MNKGWALRTIFLVLILSLLIVSLKTQVVWHWLYPVYYPEIIKQNATRFQHNPNLILAIIQTESKFSGDKTSKKGAIGLMQIMKETADWILEKGGYPTKYRELLQNPAVNVELGSWYLRYLMEYYNGNLIVALAAYNAGPGNVNRWLDSGEWNGYYDTLRQIPFGETRHYIQRVLYLYDRYGKVYNDQYWEKDS